MCANIKYYDDNDNDDDATTACNRWLMHDRNKSVRCNWYVRFYEMHNIIQHIYKIQCEFSQEPEK